MQGKHAGDFLFISLSRRSLLFFLLPFPASSFPSPFLRSSPHSLLLSTQQHVLGRLIPVPGGQWWPWAACFSQPWCAGVWLQQCSMKCVQQSCASSMETKLITVQYSKTCLTSPVLGVVSQIYCRAWTPQLALTMHCWHFSGPAQQE